MGMFTETQYINDYIALKKHNVGPYYACPGDTIKVSYTGDDGQGNWLEHEPLLSYPIECTQQIDIINIGRVSGQLARIMGVQDGIVVTLGRR